MVSGIPSEAATLNMAEPVFKSMKRKKYSKVHSAIEKDPLYGNIWPIPNDSGMECTWTEGGILRCQKTESDGTKTGYIYHQRPGLTLFSVIRNIDTTPTPKMTLRARFDDPPECIGAKATLERDFSKAKKCDIYSISDFKRFQEDVRRTFDGPH